MNTRQFHYAWVICFAGLMMMLCNMGMCSNLLTVYLPFIEESGLSHSMGSAILSIRTLFAFLALFGVRLYYQKLSLRTGILLVTLLGAASMAVFSIGGSPLVYYLAAAMVGIAYAMGSVFPSSLLITNWFHARKGLAVGISSAGSGLSTMLFSPLFSGIIMRYGLRTAFLIEGGMLAAFAVLIWAIVRDRPADMGLAPYGEGEAATAKAVEEKGQLSRGMLWVLAGMMLLNGGAGLSFSGHLSVLAKACGYPAALASGIVSVFGFTLLIGKFAAGGIADRIGTLRASILLIGIFILACLSVFGMDGTSAFWPYAMTAMIGFGAAVYNVGPPLWAGDLGGRANYARTLRWLQMFYNLGGAVFTIVPGIIADHTGEYKSSYLIFAVMMALSALILRWAYARKDRGTVLP